MKIHLDDSRLSPPEKRDRLYILQGGKCGACRIPGLPRTARGRKGKLFLDHDHYTGLVRGLLCQPCNQRAGIMGSRLMFGDYPHVTAYLTAPPAAALNWLWDFPAGWTYVDFDRLRRIGGISVLEYVRSYGLLVAVPAWAVTAARSAGHVYAGVTTRPPRRHLSPGRSSDG